tara:strand:- start:498 stop:614 length:117 start_codon:yes stop_codon:yes gene_type:complete
MGGQRTVELAAQAGAGSSQARLIIRRLGLAGLWFLGIG